MDVICAAGNLCFYGECKYYCDSHHAVCGNADVIEGSCAAWLPSGDVLPRHTWPNPWAQLYTKRNKLPRWKTEPRYCDEVRSDGPYDSGRRLLDVVDIAVFDFLIGTFTSHPTSVYLKRLSWPWLRPIRTGLLDGALSSPCRNGCHWIHSRLLRG